MFETTLAENAHIPAGHYSQAILYGDLIFVSGQLPINPRGGTIRQATIEAQAEQASRQP